MCAVKGILPQRLVESKHPDRAGRQQEIGPDGRKPWRGRSDLKLRGGRCCVPPSSHLDAEDPSSGRRYRHYSGLKEFVRCPLVRSASEERRAGAIKGLEGEADGRIKNGIA
jgi:hypothetical protein